MGQLIPRGLDGLPKAASNYGAKFTGATEKWDAAAWKTDAFYGNPLSGFAVR